MDYRGIEALYTVLELQSFEAAAKKLHITQSAVSQRIKGLETHYGEPVLIRTLPYRATTLGEFLIGHFRQISLLEQSLERQIASISLKPKLSIALNRDSLETWFLDLLDQTGIFSHLTLEIIADDQELTLDYFKKGMVSACVSTTSKEVVGGIATFLGNMEYLLVASPQFARENLNSSPQCLLKAQALKFDKNDRLHERYLEKFFGLNGTDLSYHIIPSTKGFKKYALLGYGYGLIPKIDILEELKRQELVQLFPKKVWKTPLYWHSWDISSGFYKNFNAAIIRYATQRLNDL